MRTPPDDLRRGYHGMTRAFRDAAWGQELVLAIGMGMVAVLGRESEALRLPELLWAFGGLLGFNLAYLTALRRAVRTRTAATAAAVLNTLLVTAVVLYSGGPQSRLWPMYLLPVFGACLYLSAGHAIGVYGSAALLLGWLHLDDLQTAGWEDRLPYLMKLAVIGGSAALTSHFSSKERRRRSEFKRSLVGADKLFQELRHSEEQLRSIFQEAAPGILVAAADGRILRVNPYLCHLLGWPERELLRMNVADLTEPADRARHARLLQRASRKNGPSVQADQRFKRRGGGHVWAQTTVTWLGAPRSGPECWIALVQDITEFKRTKDALREREDQLRQSHKMEAVGRLAGGVAHDFNNILSALMGYADLALGQAPPDSVLRADLEGIRSAVKSASALTSQLLAFSRRQMIRPRIVNANSLLMEMDKMLRRLIPADIELVTVLEPELRPVRADPVQLEQVLINLVLNARDALPHGGRVTLRTSNVTLEGSPQGRWQKVPPGSYVVVSVGDDGVGMSPEVLAHVFEPFFTTKDTGKGTGLGLASCWGFVRQSGGWIDVDTAPGRGTVFELFFPSLARSVRPSPEPPTGAVPHGGTETILLVEDQAQLRSVTARALRERGYRILEASNGDEALRVLERHDGRLDVLVTDMVMPQMGGPELAEHIRRLVPGVRILFTSGYTDPSRASFDTLAPGDQFLQKPFTPGILAGKVREVLEEAEGGSPDAAAASEQSGRASEEPSPP